MLLSREKRNTSTEMGKTLCEWSEKDFVKRAGKLAELLNQPTFYCTRCGRSASKSKALCKPRKLSRLFGDSAAADGALSSRALDSEDTNP